ncbi:MAG: hypothetical protein HOF71_03805 [Chloroflexi bacterium]|jgi:hypothetical protein|nr:hypothetical protein [Chloroflexota bacterium]
MPENQASTIYVSGETAQLAREIEELTGVKASRVFREFVQQYRRTMNPDFGAPVDSLAFILPALSPWDVRGPRPFLSETEDSSPRDKDLWNHVFDSTYPRAFKAFLMGKSLEHPITNHEDVWSTFVESGGVLEVLFQGDISSGADSTPRLYATNDPALNASKLSARKRTIDFLKQLSSKTPDQVVVRNSGQLLLTMNAGIIFRVDGTADMHLEFGLGETVEFTSSSIIMTARHDPPDDKYRLVAGAMEGLWLRSLPEAGFESNQ